MAGGKLQYDKHDKEVMWKEEGGSVPVGTL